MMFNLNLITSRVIALFVFVVLISTSVYSQTQIEIKEQKKDSLCQDSLKSYSDTIGLRQNHLYQSLPQSKEKSSKRLSKDFNIPKTTPHKKKFLDLQILRTIGSHISR